MLQTRVLNVGIYIFDQVEILDFAGPFEVFSTASRMAKRDRPDAAPPFDVFTVAPTPDPIAARGGLRVTPTHSLASHPPIDVLVIPGGVVDAELRRPGLAEWIADRSRDATLTISICTGAFLLAKAGLLDGRRATTHWEDIPDLRRTFPAVEVVEQVRWIDEGTILTSAGISAAIDVSLHAVRRLAGEELAKRTARQMDYAWRDDG